VPRILTTLYHLRHLPWGDNTEMVDPASHSVPGLLWLLLRRARSYDVIVLNGSGHIDQLAGMCMRRLRPKARLVLTDCTWKVEISWFGRVLTRVGIRLMDGPRTNYCVLTSAEERIFPKAWGVDPARVFLTPWYVWLSEEEENTPVSEQGFVFSGGDSLRNYRPLIQAAKTLQADVRIATRLPLPAEESDPPPNLRFGPMPPKQYFRTMCEASVVVVCLEADTQRSAGQNNYLNPVALGKLLIINDATGVGDYLDRESALIVPSSDSAALADTLRWALDPDNAEETARIVRHGQNCVRQRFTPERYVATLVKIARGVAADAESLP
jgi:hypothetical protein